MRFLGFAFLFVQFFSCQTKQKTESLPSISPLLQADEAIVGKSEYLNSPFFTAGNRVYMVGHQNGAFPELGWHVNGEMGGIWDHPIKLMDGFEVLLEADGQQLSLDAAAEFANFPFANQHRFYFSKQNLTVERNQFVPDDEEGIVVEFLLYNIGEKGQSINLTFVGHTDLRPTWLGERTNMENGQDEAEFLKKEDVWMVKDSLNPWFVAFGANVDCVAHGDFEKHYSGKGTSKRLSYDMELASGESQSIQFVVAGSYKSKESALKTYENLQKNTLSLYETKQQRYQTLASKSVLSVPDKELEKTFLWLKYNSDWLVRTVPEIGTGIAAGIPDYPWWFGVDSEYALKGLMAIGQRETALQTIRLLDSISEATNGNGRIVHEVSTNGAVYNPGNINETPQFASLIWEVYRWTGDRAFLERYFPKVKKGLEWLMAENDENKNGFPDGFGMMEIHGMDSEMIDVAAYTQRAFSDASQMAALLGETKLSKEYEANARTIAEAINRDFWSPEFGSYADFIGTDEQALRLIDDAIVRADTLGKPWAVEELEKTKQQIKNSPSKKPRPFVLHHNWVVNTPMEMGIADPEKAQIALKTAEKFVNPFGVFVTGIDRDESAGSDDGAFKGSKIFSYTGAVMTLPTSVQAVAENNYGQPDQALNYIQRMVRSFSYALPGSMYEVSPDYGMMTQAWNIYGFGVPIVQQFFGIQPMAAEKSVRVAPQMPSTWDNARLENVEIGDNSISVFYEKTDRNIRLRVRQTKADWSLKLELPKVWQGKTCRLTSEMGTATTDSYILEGVGSEAVLEIGLEE